MSNEKIRLGLDSTDKNCPRCAWVTTQRFAVRLLSLISFEFRAHVYGGDLIIRQVR